MVNFWSDAIAPTSIGTGVAKTTLNGGNDYSVSQKVKALIEVTPEAISTGALTAAESLMLRLIAESPAIPSLSPKEYVFSAGQGGLGVFNYAAHPLLVAKEYNTVMPGQTTPVTFSGQAQIANTVAVEMSVDLTFTDGGPLGPEQFYTAPQNETNTGTSAAEAAGNDITINGGSIINKLGVVITPGVVTASESYEGRATLSSTNFINVPSPQRWSAQSIATGLGTTTAVAIQADRWKKVTIPIGNSFVGNTSFILDEALTATGNFIVQVGYLKP